MLRLVAVLSFILVTSSARADDCEAFVERSKPVLDAFTKEDGVRPFTAAEYQHAVALCRRNAKARWSFELAEVVACVSAAKDPRATRTCWEDASGPYASFIRVEGEYQLDRLRKNLQVSYMNFVRFPKGKAAPTPPGPACCTRPGTTCPEAGWDVAPWKDVELDFSILGPTTFQYSYVSDGKTATATATGDIECDGTLETYTVKVSIQGGKAVATWTSPKSFAPKKGKQPVRTK